MCKSIPQYHSSAGSSEPTVSSKETIGELFRDYGEQYISIYKPPIHHIKLIRAIRVCKTPQLGGRVITCSQCGHKHYIYHSCGHAQCMLCQSIKREQWMDKLKAKLLKVPYVHMIFTLPHSLNGLARANEAAMYSLMLRAAWLTVKQLGGEQGFTPGMTAVLHTFGSDMKYHIHVHAIVTFGGIEMNENWKYPCKKYGLDAYRKVCAAYKIIMIRELNKLIKNGKLSYHTSIEDLLLQASTLRWVVHTTHPTMHTATIENYLARYINRIAVSKQRLQYAKQKREVSLLYNDYKNQQTGMPAPKELLYLSPLTAIHQIMQHVLPPRFQKSRSYGLHNASSKLKARLPSLLQRAPLTIRTIFQIITSLLGMEAYACSKCHSDQYTIEELIPDKNYIFKFIARESLKAPPPPVDISAKNQIFPKGSTHLVSINQQKILF